MRHDGQSFAQAKGYRVKLASIGGRAHIVSEAGGADIARLSGSLFPSDMRLLLGRISELRAWLETQRPDLDPSLSEAALNADLARLDAPIADPSQIFAVGLNYRAHGVETGMAIPDEPMIFTKFPSAITGPGADISLPADTVDWEVEMVIVIGRPGRNIAKQATLGHVAGFCVGQDLSERRLQMAAKPPQFSLAKSYQGFAPIGPWITTPDEVDYRDLAIGCRIGSEVLQAGTTSQMIFDVPTLISYLSSVCELRTGDLIFSGTPDGVGFSRQPPRFLAGGETLESHIDRLGRLSNRCSN